MQQIRHLRPLTSMQRTIQNQCHQSKVSKQGWTTSTFNVPAEFAGYLKYRCRQHGALWKYFRYLINTYARHLNHFNIDEPHTKKWKKKYQDAGLNLLRFDFVPDPEDWEEFRHISFAYGLAMNKFFVLLLQIEISRWMQADCPEDFFEKIHFAAKYPAKNRKKRKSVINRLKNYKINSTHLNSQSILHRVMDKKKHLLIRIAILC